MFVVLGTWEPARRRRWIYSSRFSTWIILLIPWRLSDAVRYRPGTVSPWTDQTTRLDKISPIFVLDPANMDGHGFTIALPKISINPLAGPGEYWQDSNDPQPLLPCPRRSLQSSNACPILMRNITGYGINARKNINTVPSASKRCGTWSSFVARVSPPFESNRAKHSREQLLPRPRRRLLSDRETQLSPLYVH